MNVIRWGLHSFFAVAIAGAGLALEGLLWATVLTWVTVEALVISVSDALGPKHTFESVAKELEAGLRDGSIVLEEKRDAARLDPDDHRPRPDDGDAGGDRL